MSLLGKLMCKIFDHPRVDFDTNCIGISIRKTTDPEIDIITGRCKRCGELREIGVKRIDGKWV